MNNRIVLASNSPRRKEICEKYGLKPKVIVADIDEKTSQEEGPYESVMALAFEKAHRVAQSLDPGQVVLGADTMVVYQGKKLGKPASREEARNMLHLLSGRTHQVVTGFSLIKTSSNLKLVDYVETRVTFKELTDQVIDSYLATGEPMDKAGAYGIQGLGQLLVKEIEGSYLNVVGLPIERISDLLKEFFQINLI